MQSWVVAAVLTFIIRQIGKYGKKLDWDKLRTDAHDRIGKLLPAWMVPVGTGLIDGLIAAVDMALEDQADTLAVARLVASGDLKGAINYLVGLMDTTDHSHAELVKSGLTAISAP